MIQPFTYQAPAQRVVFGRGTLGHVGDEIRRLGHSRALVLSTPAQEGDARRLAASLHGMTVGVFAGAVMHTPVGVTERALQQARGADCLISLGGGSTTGLGKAIALRTGLDQVAIPTTYAGSEATPILGQSELGQKTTQRSRDVLPEVIVYDVDLTLSLPAALSAASGLNAIAHAVEALYAPDSNPITSGLAEQGIRAFACALPGIMAEPGNVAARTQALFGAWACGTCLGTVGMGLHHKLCHVLGGAFNLPHAETHAVVLPYAAAYNAAAAPDAMQRIALALGVADAPVGLYELGRRLGLPQGLRGLGMPEAGIGQAAELAAAAPYPNPAPIEYGLILSLLSAAFAGRAPTSY